MSTKKLIAFDDRQIEKLEKYCEKTKVSFTQAVKQLTMMGLENSSKEAET